MLEVAVYLVMLFNQLPGTWKMETKQGPLFEQWKLVADNKMEGRSFYLKNADTVVLETVKLEQYGEKVFYMPTVQDQNNKQPIKFTLTSQYGKYFVFENKQHDYPQRIIYELVNQDSLHARIEGQKNGKNMFSDFFYKRVK